jgi:hypothetical protein
MTDTIERDPSAQKPPILHKKSALFRGFCAKPSNVARGQIVFGEPMDSFEIEASRGTNPLPGGCREADLHRGVSLLDDLSPARLWALLDEPQQFLLYRQFFQGEWAELSEILDAFEQSQGLEDRTITLGQAIRLHWQTWRDAAVERMAIRGQITEF